MSLPRFRLRTVMALVAVVALALGAADLWRRRTIYLRLAGAHEMSAMVLGVDSNMARGFQGDGPGARLLDLSDSMARSRRQAAYHARLRLKYERAASRPWLAVALDPPAPD